LTFFLFCAKMINMHSQLETLLNHLLEAERAGQKLLDAMTQETADPQIKALFANFTDIEVGDAAVLEGLIRLHGGVPSTKVGDFADKVLRVDNLHDQLNLLSRGQAWVARKVEQVLALNPPPDIAAFLKEMANRHRHNMEWTRAEAIKTFDEG
jgi:nitronate monooxygenase